MRVYLLRLVCICLIYAICRSILEKDTPAQKLLRLMFGMLFTFTLLIPVLQPGALDFSMPDILFDEYANAGEETARMALQDSIITRTRAYILDKAASAGMTPEVTVILCKEPPYVPEKAILSGDYDQKRKQELTSVLVSTLGLSEENIQWTDCDKS